MARGGFNFTPPDPQDIWQRRSDSDAVRQGRPSFRVALLARLRSGGPAACNFDSIILTENLPTEVPVTSPAGAALIAILLGLSGLFVLRR